MICDRFDKVWLFLLMGWVLIGCTRNADDSTQVTLNFSPSTKSVTSSSDEKITFIAVNVTGPDMERESYIYDNGEEEAPSTVELEVPSGSDRLIQVLVIVEGEAADGSDSQEFRYGDAEQDLAAGDQLIEIDYSSVVQSNSDGTASGRYFLPDGSEYTGKVTLEYTPENGNPPMEVFELEIFHGWFEVFLLEGIDLTYRLENDHVMFEGPVNQASSLFYGAANAVVTVDTTAHYDSDGDFENQRMFSVGFWQGSSPYNSLTACYDSGAFASSSKYLDDMASIPMDWPADYGIDAGSTCAVTNPLVTSTQVSISGQVLEHGGSSPILSGPYMRFLNADSYYDFIETSHDGSSLLTVSWKYLPQVTSYGVAGSTVFFNTNYEGDGDVTEGAGGLRCEDLFSQGYQAVELSGSAESAILSITSAELDDTKVVVCPRKENGEHYRSAIETHCLGSSCGGGPVSACTMGGDCMIFVTAMDLTSGDIDGDTNGSIIGDGDGNPIVEADAICNIDLNKPNSSNYKALIVDGTNRVACTSSNCSTSGAGEHVDWVLEPFRNYQRPDGTPIGSTQSTQGIFNFNLTNSIDAGAAGAWTGLTTDFRKGADTCSDWSTASGAVYGYFGTTSNTVSNSIGGGASTCDGTTVKKLYCVEQP